MMDLRFRPMDRRVAPDRRSHARADFSSGWTRVIDELERELRHLKATEIQIECGLASHQIRGDGWPRGGAMAAHPDVRLWFQTADQGPLTFECAHFDRYEHNLRAIGLCLQDLRLMKQRGVGTGREQYRGFSALPPGNGIAAAEWADAAAAMRFLSKIGDGEIVSELPRDLREVYRAAARKAHPDAGGSQALMDRVNRARDFIEKAAALREAAR